MTILIDPASGWKYGFPKPYTKAPEETLKDWLVANGYPEKMAQQVEDNELWCRFIEPYEELIKMREEDENNLS